MGLYNIYLLVLCANVIKAWPLTEKRIRKLTLFVFWYWMQNKFIWNFSPSVSKEIFLSGFNNLFGKEPRIFKRKNKSKKCH